MCIMLTVRLKFRTLVLHVEQQTYTHATSIFSNLIVHCNETENLGKHMPGYQGGKVVKMNFRFSPFA